MEGAIDQIHLNFTPGSLISLNVILGVLMFGVALDIKLDDFRRIVRDPRGPLIGLGAQFLLLPAATFAITMLIQPPPSVALGMILVAACPGGNISNFLTYLSRGNTALSVAMTATSTAVAVVMTPFNLTFWGSLNPHTAKLLHQVQLDPMEVFVIVLVILGMPLVIGMLVGAHFPRLVERLRKPVRYFGVAVFLLFVVMAIRANLEHFHVFLLPAFLMVVLHNATALATGYFTARVLRLSEYDARAISIEVGIQNSGLGLALIFDFFTGLGGMAIVAAFWGIWHIVSGLSLSTFWSARPLEPEPKPKPEIT